MSWIDSGARPPPPAPTRCQGVRRDIQIRDRRREDGCSEQGSHCRLQSDLSGVAPAQETAGAPHGLAGGPSTVNWIGVRSASLEFSLARVPDWQHQGQQHRRASPPVVRRVFQVVLFLPRGALAELSSRPNLRGSKTSQSNLQKALLKTHRKLPHRSQFAAQTHPSDTTDT